MQVANGIPHCPLCGDYHENDFNVHKGSRLHRFNFLLMEFSKYRKKVMADQGGITFSHAVVKPNNCEITDNFISEKGSYKIKVSPSTFMTLDRTITVQLKICNVSCKSTVYAFLTLLHPYPAFSLTSTGTVYMLRKGESFTDTATIQFQEDIIGSIKMPIALTVQLQKDKDSKWFNIYRDVVLHVKEGNEVEEYCKENPFKSDVFNNVITVIGPTNLPPISNNYLIPPVSEKAVWMGLKYVATMSIEEGAELRRILRILTEGVTERNYADFFHYLLWLDEAGATLGLQRYNMTGVTVNLIRGTVELMVPGLAEKRPSIIVGDLVSIRVNNDHTFYQGVVNLVTDKSIFIKEFNEEFIKILEDYPGIQLDVRFEFQRLQHERMHKGVDKCIENRMLGVLFPQRIVFTTASKTLDWDQLFNKCIMVNKEQKTAVENILSCTSGIAPYIVFGPPGTGKTVTIVEAILQLKTAYPKRNILVCAPSNAACDMLAQKLIEHKCTEAELIRVHSTTREISLIPVGIRRFSNLEGTDFLVVRGHELKKYKIVISTLHLIGKYTGQYSPDYLFIDEAAQATEPECDIAIGLLAPNKQIILAGDPKQLGPVITSKVAIKYGLEQSLLERLMNTIDIYSPIQRRPLTFNPQYITMLVKNFRSHEGIIHIPNTLFYGGALECHAHLDPISKKCISQKVCGSVPVKMKNDLGVSVEFCGVVSKEARTGSSPSFFNEIEIQMVVKYVTALIQEFAVRTEDIGVISPYIRQVHRIKQQLCGKGWGDVEVGTTEAFQGREKRVMIISTVRAQHSLLRYDKKYNLGFVKNERRFNVALTRAKAKLIVVGNPFCLGHDKECWGEFIEFCQEYKTYFGMDYQPRTDRVKREIIDRFEVSKLKIKRNP